MIINRFNLRKATAIVACLAANKVATIQKYSIVLFGIACIIMTACSSPESDGIKAAKMKYDLQTEYYKKSHSLTKEISKERVKAYESYIGKFASFSFITRIDAREKLNEFLEPVASKERESSQKLQEETQESQKKFYEYYESLRNKYATNKEKLDKFDFAGNHYQPKERMQQEDISDLQGKLSEYQAKVKSLIASIIPPKPDLARLKNEMIGRTISNQTTGYSNWKINSLDELKNLEIQSASDKGDEYLINIRLPLQGATNQFDANANIKYVLGQNDDWKLETFDGKMDIVLTGKYRSCIKTQYVQESAGFMRGSFNRLQLSNSCDETLLVVGEYLPVQGNNWSNFSITISAKETSLLYIGKFSIYDNFVRDYKITFIERAGL